MPRPSALIASLLVLYACLMVLPLLGVVKPPELVENRVPAQRPPLAMLWGNLQKFRTDLDSYLADHFPARRFLIGGLNYLRYELGYSGTKRVLVGRDGWLFYDDGNHLSQARASTLAPVEAQAWVAEQQARSAWLARKGASYVVLAAPVKERLFLELVPGELRRDQGAPDSVVIAQAAARAGAQGVLDLHAPLAAAKAAGVRIYTPYDTHWTGEGAYVAYAEVLRGLAARGVPVTPKPRAFFNDRNNGPDVPVPQDLAYMLGIADFVRQDYPQLGFAHEPRVEYLTDRRDWTGDRVIDTGSPGPVLMLTGDSFSNAWLPLFEASFSRIVFSHHQNGFFRPDLVERFQPDAVVLEVIESGFRHAMPPRVPVVVQAPIAKSQ